MAFANPLTLATVVQATTFELIDTNGSTVSTFGDTGTYLGWPTFGLEFDHLDATAQPSTLRWTVANPPGGTEAQEFVAITGPATAAQVATNDQPAVYLVRDNTPTSTSVQITSGRPAGVANAASLSASGSSGTGRSTVRLIADDVSITPDPATGFVRLGGKPAYLLIAFGLVRSSANQNINNASNTAIPGCVLPNVSLRVGDLVKFTISADFGWAGVTAGDIGIASPSINGVSSAAGPQLVHATAVAPASGRLLATQTWTYQIPVTGLYTFGIDAIRLGSNVGTFTVNATHTTLHVDVFSTH